LQASSERPGDSHFHPLIPISYHNYTNPLFGFKLFPKKTQDWFLPIAEATLALRAFPPPSASDVVVRTPDALVWLLAM
jgi:hypothetical protein